VLESDAEPPWNWPTYRQASGTPVPTHVPVMLPPLPSGFVGQLIDLIETIPPDEARPLVTLVRRVQVQHTRSLAGRQRILNQPAELVLRADLLCLLIDAIEVQTRCNRLIPYARGEKPAPLAVLSEEDVKRYAFKTVSSPLLEEIGEQIDFNTGFDASWLDGSDAAADRRPSAPLPDLHGD
jgi:hypothetical protein